MPFPSWLSAFGRQANLLDYGQGGTGTVGYDGPITATELAPPPGVSDNVMRPYSPASDGLLGLRPGEGPPPPVPTPRPSLLPEMLSARENSPIYGPTATQGFPAAQGQTPPMSPQMGGMAAAPAPMSPQTGDAGGGGVMDWLRSPLMGGGTTRGQMISQALLGASRGILSAHGPRNNWIGGGILGAAGGVERAQQQDYQRQAYAQQMRLKQLAAASQAMQAQAAYLKATKPEAGRLGDFGNLIQHQVDSGAMTPDEANQRIGDYLKKQATAGGGGQDPEFVKTLRAAGIDPGSPQGQALMQKRIAYELDPNRGRAQVNLETKFAPVIDAGIRGPTLTEKADEKQLESLSAAWAGAQQSAGDINALADMALHGQQEGGALSPLKTMATNIGTSLGMDMKPEDVAKANDQTLFNQLTARMVPRMRVAGSGTTSDRDMAAFKQSLPAVTDTKQQQIMMALALKQANDWMLKSRDATYAHLEGPGKGRLAGSQAAVTKAAGDSWLPVMTAEEAQSQPGPVLFRDRADGRIKVWTGG